MFNFYFWKINPLINSETKYILALINCSFIFGHSLVLIPALCSSKQILNLSVLFLLLLLLLLYHLLRLPLVFIRFLDIQYLLISGILIHHILHVRVHIASSSWSHF